jgi:hypothetical protein
MKTTIDLPDELFVAAKKRAADERRPLRDLVTRGLRAQLQHAAPSRRRGPAIEWVTVKGGVPPGMNIADREAMHDSLRRSR